MLKKAIDRGKNLVLIFTLQDTGGVDGFSNVFPDRGSGFDFIFASHKETKREAKDQELFHDPQDTRLKAKNKWGSLPHCPK